MLFYPAHHCCQTAQLLSTETNTPIAAPGRGRTYLWTLSRVEGPGGGKEQSQLFSTSRSRPKGASTSPTCPASSTWSLIFPVGIHGGRSQGRGEKKRGGRKRGRCRSFQVPVQALQLRYGDWRAPILRLDTWSTVRKDWIQPSFIG